MGSYSNRPVATNLENPAQQDVLAAWDKSLVRYFLVDFDDGNDANLGYIDAAEGSTLDPTGIAKKTWSGFSAIFPRNGAGRRAVVLFKNDSTSGTTYGEAFDFAGTHGYAQLTRRGSTDLTNSTTDRILVGAMTGLAGPNGDGSWTATAGTTSSVTVASGLTVEGSGTGMTYMRVRFTSNTTTASLRNICANIWRNSATLIEFEQAFAAAAVAGDTFFIERAGVIATEYRECSQLGTLTSAAGTQKTSAVVGIGVSSSTAGGFTVGCSGLVQYAFCETRTSTTSAVLRSGAGGSVGSIVFDTTYPDETGTARRVGGFRCQSGFTLAPRTLRMNTGGFGCGTTMSTVSFNQAAISSPFVFMLGGLVFRGLRLNIGAASSAFDTQSSQTNLGNFGSTAKRWRFVGVGALFLGNGMHLWGAEAEGCTAAVITVGQDGAGLTDFGGTFAFDDIVASAAGGNTDVGIDLSRNFIGGEVVIGRHTAVTLSGTLGDLRLAGGAITTYAGLTKTNVVDKNRTNVMGTAGAIVSQCKLVTNDHGSALAIGEVVRPAGVTGQVVKAQANALPAQHEVCGVMVTPPADNAVGYMANGPVVYALTDGAPTAGGTVYLDEGTAGLVTTTVPPNNGVNRKLRCGGVIDVLTTPDACYMDWNPEQLSAVSDAAR